MRRYGLIGRPLGHSFSAGYFTEKFRREGIVGCDYALYELPSIGRCPICWPRSPNCGAST